MSTTFDAESKLTDRYQTTVPETIRRALKLTKRDRLHYAIRENGDVVLTRASSLGDDAVVEQFLGFLARDLASHPERIAAVDSSLVERLKTLVGQLDVDISEELSADDE